MDGDAEYTRHQRHREFLISCVAPALYHHFLQPPGTSLRDTLQQLHAWPTAGLERQVRAYGGWLSR